MLLIYKVVDIASFLRVFLYNLSNFSFDTARKLLVKSLSDTGPSPIDYNHSVRSLIQDEEP